ncbi:transcriptional regulator BetI [Tabrizicola sp.]|uniref:transcriptional regulator BetI n=1 Tax=Tabrizicola sp. TaxID=2005166 RepID=UPI002FDDD884
MPKVGMEPVRRRQIIAATMACIHEEGIAKASFGRIARKAGVAPALIQHYFEDKETLLLETFRSIYREFTSGIRRRLALARTPEEKVTALMEAQIAPSVLTPEAVNSWLAIYALIREFPLLQRIEHAYDRRFISNLSHALRDMGLSAEEAREVAEELAIFIDGLWQNAANPVTFTPERSRDLLYRVLHRRLPGHSFTPPEDETPRREAEDARLGPEARQFLRDNLPVGAMSVSAASLPAFRDNYLRLSRPEGRAAARDHAVALTRMSVGGVDSLVIRPKEGLRPGAQRVFYLFGGGYISGEPEADLPISAALAARLGARITSPAYRLAPEHPWPAAPQDALAAYRAFVADAGAPFAVVGESAGGGLAMAMLQAARREGLAMPAAMALLSPWVDAGQGLPCANDGWDPTVSRRHLADAARLYAGAEATARNPSVSPLHGSMEGMPPALIITGSRDLLREQAHALAAALERAGTPVVLRDWPGLWHVFEFYRVLPEAAASLDEIAAFLRSHLSPETHP